MFSGVELELNCFPFLSQNEFRGMVNGKNGIICRELFRNLDKSGHNFPMSQFFVLVLVLFSFLKRF